MSKARTRAYYVWKGNRMYAMQLPDEKPIDAAIRSIVAKNRAYSALVCACGTRVYRVILSFRDTAHGVGCYTTPPQMLEL